MIRAQGGREEVHSKGYSDGERELVELLMPYCERFLSIEQRGKVQGEG
jgi:hypothetical protein